MEFVGHTIPLSTRAVDFTAEALDVGLPAIWAVLTVETSGCGFLVDRRLQILFERHKFHAATDGRFDEIAPDLSDAVPGGYGEAGSHQYERLHRAIALDGNAALESTSWGLGQIMGFNAAKVGFADVTDMIEKFRDSEDQQLGAMMRFIERAQLAPALRAENWAAFARRYNGDDFRKNGYDDKLAAFHVRYKAGPLPDLTIRWMQMALTFVGIRSVGAIDGVLGRRTQDALRIFQSSNGIGDTGEADDPTVAALASALGWNLPE